MTDYILRFPSKLAAEQFGIASGFASANEDGEVQSNLASHTHAMCVVGDYDGAWWVLFRDLVGIPIPDGAEQFIHWSSTSGDPRPTDESTPNIFWA